MADEYIHIITMEKPGRIEQTAGGFVIRYEDGEVQTVRLWWEGAPLQTDLRLTMREESRDRATGA